MSHWAEISESNIVLRVLVGDNNDSAGDEGYSWLVENLGGTWIQTSYNAASNGFRFNFAGIGYTYDPIDDAFIAPSPCAHAELELTQSKQWNCSNPEHIKSMENE
jgi:hypothetical protein